MRTHLGTLALGLALAAALSGCGTSGGGSYEITGPNQVVLEVSGMT